MKKVLSLNIKEYCNAIYLPQQELEGELISGVYDREGNYIQYTHKRSYGKAEYLTTDKKFKSKDLIEDDNEVYYMGAIKGHYGHFLVDEISRLWGLNTELKSDLHYIKIAFDTCVKKIPEYYYVILELLGVKKENIIHVRSATRFKKIIIPELSYMPSKYIGEQYFQTFNIISDAVIKKYQFQTYKKIYLSRRKITKTEFGECRIQEIFANNGYKVIYPEEYNILEQIYMYSHCEKLATTNGTLAHNILWCNENTELIILNRYVVENIHQNMINEKHKRVEEIVCCPKSATHNLSYMYLTTEFKKWLEDNNFKFSKYTVSGVLEALKYYLRYFKAKLRVFVSWFGA